MEQNTYSECTYTSTTEYKEALTSIDAQNAYSTHFSEQFISDLMEQMETFTKQKQQGDSEMNTIKDVAKEVVTETQTNAAIISGEILLDNIETLSERLILSRIPWWKRFLVSKKDKEIAVTVAVYGVVYALKTGGFGLTSYRVNHKAMDYVTLAANKRMIEYIMSSLGVDFNVAKMLLTVPTVTQEG